MENIGFLRDGETLNIVLMGHIDSANAPACEKAIMDGLEAESVKAVVLDADKLEYISSAGLRILLRLKKKYSDLKIVNVSSSVYEVLEMTGFTEILNVEKAYRNLSIEGCEVIGTGANGVVYRLDSDTIIKVYRNPDSLPEIHRERELARTAFVAGIPTAIPYDVVKVGNSYGSVFELLNATSFAKIIANEPQRLDEIVEKYVDMLKKIHNATTSNEDIPSMKETALDWSRFLKGKISDERYEKLMSLVEAVPETNHLMHGDYHIKNVMLQDGETLLIDMDTICRGNPVFEFASIYLAYVGFGETDPSVVEKFLGIDYAVANRIWKETLRLYFGTDNERELDEIEAKSTLISYLRLLRRTIKRDPENTAFIEHCKAKLEERIDAVDSLIY